jgi:hypothetical protein
LSLKGDGVRVNGLQIEVIDGNTDNPPIRWDSVTPGTSYGKVSNCRLRADANSGQTINLLSLEDGNMEGCDVYNVICYARSDNQGNIDSIYCDSSDATAGDMRFYNVIVYNVRRGPRDNATPKNSWYDSAIFYVTGGTLDWYNTQH